MDCYSLWLKGLGSSFSLLAVALLMGCRSVERVEMVEVHDTLRVVMTDTVVRERTLTVRDTVMVRVTDSVIVKVDADGNVSRERYREESKVTATERDTQKLDAKKSERDTERSRNAARELKEENKVSRVSVWDRLKGVLSMLGSAVVGYIVGWYVKRRPPAE